MNNELLSEEDIQKQISAMGDSIWLINKLINEPNYSKETYDIIERNVHHLEIMLEQAHIQNSGSDLKPFKKAITDGKVFTEYSKSRYASESAPSIKPKPSISGR